MKPQQKRKIAKALKSSNLEEMLQAIIDAFSENYTALSMSLKTHPSEKAKILAEIEKSTHKKWLWILKILSRSENRYDLVFRICDMQIPDNFRERRNRILAEKIYPSWIEKGWSGQTIRLSRILKIKINPDDIKLMARNKNIHGRNHSALVLEKCAQIYSSRPARPALA